MHPHTTPATTRAPIPAPRIAASDFAAAAIEAHEAEVARLASDIQDVMGRAGNVSDEDLFALGWSLPRLTELLPDALLSVRLGAERLV